MIYGQRQQKGLFATSRLSDFIDDRVSAATSEAKSLPAETFEANSDEQITDHIVSKYLIQEISIKENEKDVNLIEDKIDARNLPNRMIFDERRPVYIDSYNVTWTIPVSGTPELFELQPSSYVMSTIQGEISHSGNLVLTTNQPADASDENAIDTDLSRQLNLVKRLADNSSKDLANYNDRLKDQVGAAVANRREALNKIAKLKTALKVPVQPKSGAGPLHKVDVVVQRISPLSKKEEDSSAYIDNRVYESILSVINSMGTSMETSRASESKDEEALRDIMLVGLNASIETGSAGAETFRKKGKTDIAVLFENKAAFVAECKLWHGEKYLHKGIDQLLGYLTWRDAKTAVIIYNKDNKNFSDLQSKIDAIFTKHPQFIKTVSTKEGQWRFVFKKPDDDNRLITIHVFLFDVFDAKEKEK
ncbi:MAG: hypothetical protein WD061_00215 [Candidatus Saccharimonadales bacterium]